jgi:hypothetical protein
LVIVVATVLGTTSAKRGLSGAEVMITVEPQHQFIALDNAADCFLSADLSSTGGIRKPRARKSRRHAPQPQPASRVAHELVHVANAGIPKAVALAPRLVFVKAG